MVTSCHQVFEQFDRTRAAERNCTGAFGFNKHAGSIIVGQFVVTERWCGQRATKGQEGKETRTTPSTASRLAPALTSSRTISAKPLSAAHNNAVHPPPSAASGFAPLSTNALAAASCPLVTAHNNGVLEPNECLFAFPRPVQHRHVDVKQAHQAVGGILGPCCSPRRSPRHALCDAGRFGGLPGEDRLRDAPDTGEHWAQG